MDDKQAAEIIAGQAKLEGKIDTLTARLEAHLDSNGKHVDALFDRTSELQRQIAAIMVDYTPKGEFAAMREENREDHTVLQKAVGDVKWKVAGFGGGIMVVMYLLNLAAKSLGAN